MANNTEHDQGNQGQLANLLQPNNSSYFPGNLDRTQELPHALENYTTKWNEYSARIFRPLPKHALYFCGLTAGTDGAYTYHEKQTTNLAELKAHQMTDQADPDQKYIHIASKTSRSPLACSREEMEIILTDHQVMASFVNLLFTFSNREEAHHLTTFKVEDHLEQTFRRLELKQLNRSGIRTQHCFNVLGIEKNGDGDWQQRQVAAYHSFDVLEARGAWIIVKADGAIRKRLTTDAKNIGLKKSKDSLSPYHAFGQTLRDHLLILQWCTEGWTEYLEMMEEKCREATEMTRRFDIPALVEDAPKWREKQRAAELADQNTNVPTPSTLQRAASKLTGIPNTRTPTMGPPHRQDTFKCSVKKLSKMDVLEKLRDLRRYSVEMQDMMSRLEQSARVVEGIRTRYHNLVRSRKFTQHLQKQQKTKFREYADDFEAECLIILGSLESFRTRIRTVHDCREHEGDVFNHILQACSMSSTDYYATASRESTDAMQTMTEHMHHKTVSMHVITIFTLIFLPGTFVATVFSSGILTFGDEGSIGFGTRMGDWKVRIAGVKLFFAICMPLLVLTFGAWLVVYWVARRDGYREGKSQGDLEQAVDEKRDRADESGTSSTGGATAPARQVPAGQPGPVAGPHSVAAGS